MTITYLLWALAFLGLAHSHMIMNTPTPYNLHGTTKLVQVNPLGPSFPFPCQGLSDTITTTPVTAGASQLVKFTGGAQHGGGSCQFSITYDFPPPADKSKWKTIYTLIGGCPVSAEGNLPVTGSDQDGRADAAHCGNDSGTECIREFSVPIPKGLPSGNATFAWTWFNKIGNREVYMNCAPVSITGGSAGAEGEAFLKELPSLFLANVPGACTTGNGVLNIPNPGKYGRVLEQPAPGSEGSCAKAAGIPVFEGGSGGGSGSASSAVASSVGQVSTAIPSVSSLPNPASSTATSIASSGFVTRVSSTGGNTRPTSLVVIPIPDNTTITRPTSLVVIPIPDTTATTRPTSLVVIPIPNTTTGAGSGSGSGSSSGKQPCSPDGALVCFSPTSFGLCANGLAIPQAVAPGTTCTDGKIVRRSAKFSIW